MTKLELMKKELEEKKNLLKEDHYKDINDPVTNEMTKRVRELELEVQAENEKEENLAFLKKELAVKNDILEKYYKDSNDWVAVSLRERVEFLEKYIEPLEKARIL